MKFIAALCMVIDHVGLVFFPEDIRWRIIGRLAMPIFAYGVARGAFYTTSLKKYMKKMLLFSFISQIPFWGMRYIGLGGPFITLKLNVGFTFLLALLSIRLLKKGGIVQEQPLEVDTHQLCNSRLQKVRALIGAIGCIVVADILQCDYGSYGVLMVLMGYLLYFKGAKISYMAFGYMLLTLLFYSQDVFLCFLQGIGVMAYGIIYVTKNISEKRFGKLFYWFYPLHMLVISLVRWWQLRG